MRKLIFLFFIILNPSFFLAQSSFKQKVIDPIQNNTLLREKVFIHTNKTTYFKNETIWFKAYVGVDATNSPSTYTTNLIVNLLDNQGDIIKSKTLFIKQGIGSGFFIIDKKLKTGNYYIHAYTNFMKNFESENLYVQQIQITNTSSLVNKSTLTKNDSNSYDIQVFPESGYLLENSNNTIGIKALINNKGEPYIGKIKNTKGEEIGEFKSNELGFSKSNFFYDLDETYKIVLQFKTVEKEINLPKAQETGFIFSIDNSNESKLKLTLKTNKKTLLTHNKDTLAFLVYRNNHISEAVTLALNNNSKTTQDFYFDKSKMLYGVNIFTLFKNNSPIAERKLFIENINHQTALIIKNNKSTNESISYTIKSVDSNFKPILSELSVAIISKQSKIYNEQQNIKSAFLLTPYIKGHIERPAYYFNTSNSDRKTSLDLLLLCQGWISYNLNDKIQNINPKKKYKFESGFTINGSIKNPNKNYNIGILSKQNRLAAFSEINANDTFSFQNIYAYKYDSLKFTLIKKDKTIKKPNKISLNDYLPIKENYKNLINSINTRNKVLTLNNAPIFNDEIEELDTITLNNIKSKKKDSNYEKEYKIASKHKLLAPTFFQNKKVTKKMEEKYITLIAYLTHIGCTIKVDGLGNNFLVLRQAPTTFYGQNGTQGFNAAKIYINDVTLPSFDIKRFSDLQMHEIDEILINRLGAGEGITGSGGVLKIYLKNNGHKYYDEEPINYYEKLVLLTGYDRSSDYYRPIFDLTKSSLNWIEIDWKNSLKTNNEGEVIINIPKNKFSNEFKFIINGFSENGLLLHDIYTENSNEF